MQVDLAAGREPLKEKELRGKKLQKDFRRWMTRLDLRIWMTRLSYSKVPKGTVADIDTVVDNGR